MSTHKAIWRSLALACEAMAAEDYESAEILGTALDPVNAVHQPPYGAVAHGIVGAVMQYKHEKEHPNQRPANGYGYGTKECDLHMQCPHVPWPKKEKT